MSRVWRTRETNGVMFVSLDELFDDFRIVAGFSTRHGGVSIAPFETLNMGLHVGDRREDVLENRRRLAGEIGLSLESMVFADQVHSGRVRVVGAPDRGRGAHCCESAIAATDGLITASSGTALVLTFADCVPIILLAPSVPAVGVVHAGWRGTAASIAASAVVLMSGAFGVERSDILAVVGPAIGPCCYEVSEEVANAVKKADGSASPHSADPVVAIQTCGQGATTRLDLPGQSIIQLAEVGVPDYNISQIHMCTSCRRDLFFSHRAERGRTGRFAAFAYIVPPGYNRTGEEVAQIDVAVRSHRGCAKEDRAGC